MGTSLFDGYSRPLPMSKGTSRFTLLTLLLDVSGLCVDGHHVHNKEEEATMHLPIFSQRIMYQNYCNPNKLGVMIDRKANHSVANYRNNRPVQVDR